MAGFFGFFDYTKPGPGVQKDESPKPRIVLFFDILFRKFWNLLKLNMMFFLFNIPAVLAMLFLMLTFVGNLFTDDVTSDLILKFILGSIFICIPILTVGPAQAGFTYILRNYSREEHAFLWWDFKDNAKRNFKESLIISIIDLVIFVVVLFDIRAYFLFSKGSFLMSLASGFLILAFVIYMMMHMYIYPMLVTFKLSVKQIYRNALLFAMMKFLPNLGILLICAAVLVATFWNPIIGFILFPFITLSLIGFITNFYVYPQLKKHMMDKVEIQPSTNVEKVFEENHKKTDK